MSILGLICLAVALALLLRSALALKQNQLHLKSRDSKPRPAVLIAARDESRVIEGLLDSLANQSVKVPAQDIYVIVESPDDPTVEICTRYQVSVILRTDLTKQRKGYALDEAIRQILRRGEHYDLYFIFDADNVLAKDYIAQMLRTYERGYDIATGYRHAKNGNKNVITAVSSLTFSMINVMSNRERAKYGANIVFSGTGYYIDGTLVDEWRGWPFQSLTEDYEISLYATLHGLSTTYNEKAVFYDEQPTKYRQTVDQRVRWIKGYFAARAKYVPLIRVKKQGDNYGSLVKESIGVQPAIWAIIGTILILIGGSIDLLVAGQAKIILLAVPAALLVVYIVLAIITVVMLKREKQQFTRKRKWQAIIFNPIYLVSYIPCALKAFFKRDVQWNKIEHGR